jgi:hypothetical protein
MAEHTITVEALPDEEETPRTYLICTCAWEHKAPSWTTLDELAAVGAQHVKDARRADQHRGS